VPDTLLVRHLLAANERNWPMPTFFLDYADDVLCRQKIASPGSSWGHKNDWWRLRPHISVRISDKARNIPSLDGMRGISILLVVAGHSAPHFAGWIRIPTSLYVLSAHTGVSIFFVISGFLITSLLLKELHGTGTIGLKGFYLRRAFRIFPPFYLYLSILFFLTVAGVFQVPLCAFFFAATYTSNYYLGPGGAFIGLQHLWSLSVEEQFYLLWPAVLLLLGKRWAICCATLLIFISPLSRVLTYFVLSPQNRAVVDRMFHSRIDTIMFGCLTALLWQSNLFERTRRIWESDLCFASAVLFLCCLDPLLDLRFHGRYGLTVGMTLEGVSICLIALYVVTQPGMLPGRLLNTPLLRHIGVISYSLYLWQNILTGESFGYFPYNLAALLVCAELSYWGVERPSLRLRDRLLRT
jgi:peptidoglycan/LPS O-acetylase OafA/YrhL